jgi:hypothetical protein
MTATATTTTTTIAVATVAVVAANAVMAAMDVMVAMVATAYLVLWDQRDQLDLQDPKVIVDKWVPPVLKVLKAYRA